MKRLFIIITITISLIITSCSPDLTTIKSQEECEDLGPQYIWNPTWEQQCSLKACGHPDVQDKSICRTIGSCKWFEEQKMCCKDYEEVIEGRLGTPICCAKGGLCD